MDKTLLTALKLMPTARAVVALSEAESDREQALLELKALVEKYGARNSRADQSVIQDAHDLMVKLGAMCGGFESKSALVWRHPGHPNQKVHGNRYGAGQAKESLRRLKDDKAARERYKATARTKSDKQKLRKVGGAVKNGYEASRKQVSSAKEYYTGNPALAGGKVLPPKVTKEKIKNDVKAELEKTGAINQNRMTGRNENRAITNTEAESIAQRIGQNAGFTAGIYDAFNKGSDALPPSEISQVVFDELKKHNKKAKTKRDIFGRQVDLTQDLF